jgi:hypothetical protein
VTELILRYGIGVVNLVAEDDKRDFGKLLHGEEGIELGLGLGKTLVVLSVDEEDDTVDFREVILPEPAGCRTGNQSARENDRKC